MAERRFSQWRNLGLAAPVIFAASRARRPSPVQLASECCLRGFAVAGVATGSLKGFWPCCRPCNACVPSAASPGRSSVERSLGGRGADSDGDTINVIAGPAGGCGARPCERFFCRQMKTPRRRLGPPTRGFAVQQRAAPGVRELRWANSRE